MRVGVAGVGRMGAAIAAHLIDVGHVVTVWNRAAEKTGPLAKAGAKVAATPAELAGGVEAVITILTNRDAQAAVYEGPSGLLAWGAGGKLFIDMSTVQPHEAVALAEKVRAKGGVFVECPVGGTVGPARQGKLLGVAGATREDFEKAKPLLDQMCRRVELVGPVGAGASMKLALNLPLLVYYQALAEATTGVHFVGRLATYRYYNMDQVVAQALTLYAKISGARRLSAAARRAPAQPVARAEVRVPLQANGAPTPGAI